MAGNNRTGRRREREEEGEKGGRKRGWKEERGKEGRQGGRREARVTNDCVPFYSPSRKSGHLTLTTAVLLHAQDLPQTEITG